MYKTIVIFPFKFRSFQKTANANTNLFELISANQGQSDENDPFLKDEDVSECFNGDYENLDPNTFDQTELIPTKSGMVNFGKAHARPNGIKRAKITHTIDDNSMVQASGEVMKDDHSVFGEFVASELRDMKSDECRREVKRAIQQCLLDGTGRDAAIAAKRDE